MGNLKHITAFGFIVSVYFFFYLCTSLYEEYYNMIT